MTPFHSLLRHILGAGVTCFSVFCWQNKRSVEFLKLDRSYALRNNAIRYNEIAFL